MLRGIEKQVIVLNNTDSKIFEQAIFILRDCKDFKKIDLLNECEKIINEKSINKTSKRSNQFIKITLSITIALLTIIAFLLLINLL